MISQLQRIGEIHKRRPEHASLGVLRSPDIPSVLVETGFISNNSEERLLASDDYDDISMHRLRGGEIVALDDQYTFLQRIPRSHYVLAVGPVPYLYYLHQTTV